MKRLLLYIALPVLFFTACTRHTNESSGKPFSDSRQTVKSFSDLKTLDTFKVALKGKDASDMVISLRITAASGREIYGLDIKAAELISNYKESVAFNDEAQKVQFLKEELNLFFDEENFLEPAITADEEPDQQAPDKAFYAELKQTGLNGFTYRLGKETKVYIAWSVKEQRTKIYYQCCQP